MILNVTVVSWRISREHKLSQITAALSAYKDAAAGPTAENLLCSGLSIDFANFTPLSFLGERRGTSFRSVWEWPTLGVAAGSNAGLSSAPFQTMCPCACLESLSGTSADWQFISEVLGNRFSSALCPTPVPLKPYFPLSPLRALLSQIPPPFQHFHSLCCVRSSTSLLLFHYSSAYIYLLPAIAFSSYSASCLTLCPPLHFIPEGLSLWITSVESGSVRKSERSQEKKGRRKD